MKRTPDLTACPGWNMTAIPAGQGIRRPASARPESGSPTHRGAQDFWLRAAQRLRTLSLGAAVLGGLVAALSGCGDFGKKSAEEKKDAVAEVPLVRAAVPARRTLNRVLEITGEVEALSRIEFGARLAGPAVIALLADLGSEVKEGDVLAKLDPTDVLIERDDARVAAAEAQVRLKDAQLATKELEAQLKGQKSTTEQARKSLERARAQAQRGAIAEEQLESAVYKHEQELAAEERMGFQIEKAKVAHELATKTADKAANALAKAERNVLWADVRSPISGIVSKRAGKLGQIMAAGQPLFEVFDPNSSVVAAQITQRDLPHVSRGLKVELRSDAWPGEVFDAEVSMVSPVVDPQAGTVPIRVALKEHSKLKPGLFVSGRVVVEAKPNVLVIPKKAVIYERERPFVFKLEGGTGDTARVSRIFFKEGLSGRDEVEMIFGDEAEGKIVTDGDRIVLVGQDRLRDGDTVQIESAGATSRAADQASSRPGTGH